MLSVVIHLSNNGFMWLGWVEAMWPTTEMEILVAWSLRYTSIFGFDIKRQFITTYSQQKDKLLYTASQPSSAAALPLHECSWLWWRHSKSRWSRRNLIGNKNVPNQENLLSRNRLLTLHIIHKVKHNIISWRKYFGMIILLMLKQKDF